MLSIIVPVYNAGKYLSPCIWSILNNDYQNFELLLVLDEPTDGSDLVCQEFAKTDSRIRVISVPHGGPSPARNKGIEESKGEWIAFVDHDDTILPNRFTDTIKAAYEHSVKIVSCSINKVLDGNVSKIIKKYPPGIIKFGGHTTIFGMCTNLIFDSKLIKDNDIRFPDCTIGDDSLFAIEAFFLAGELYNIGIPLYNLTRGHSSLSNSPMSDERKQKLLDEANRIIKKYSSYENDDLFKETLLSYIWSRPIFKK